MNKIDYLRNNLDDFIVELQDINRELTTGNNVEPHIVKLLSNIIQTYYSLKDNKEMILDNDEGPSIYSNDEKKSNPRMFYDTDTDMDTETDSIEETVNTPVEFSEDVNMLTINSLRSLNEMTDFDWDYVDLFPPTDNTIDIEDGDCNMEDNVIALPA